MMAAQKTTAKKVATKKPVVKKTSGKKATAKKTAVKKAAVKKKLVKKPAAKKLMPKKAAPKKATRKKVVSKPSLSIEKISAGARKLMLANLGLYGTVMDELEAQAAKARDAIERARREAPEVNSDLIHRGEALVSDIRSILDKADMPSTPKLDKQIDKLRGSIKKLRKRLS
ncbi:histone H1-like repetitive region-containing protein [Pseudomonadales bacterium]|nr:histone H1-like repetitive region-containing protein [Pseudomonadales bacterium]MDB4363578.1 histone H1-like repetitive region-containing protein [Pseudomonadales bacterium]